MLPLARSLSSCQLAVQQHLPLPPAPNVAVEPNLGRFSSLCLAFLWRQFLAHKSTGKNQSVFFKGQSSEHCQPGRSSAASSFTTILFSARASQLVRLRLHWQLRRQTERKAAKFVRANLAGFSPLRFHGFSGFSGFSSRLSLLAFDRAGAN